MENDSMRDEFEAWAKDRYNLLRHDESYAFCQTHRVWQAWNAALAARPPVGVEPVAWIVGRANQIGGVSDHLEWNRGKVPYSSGHEATPLYTTPPAPAAVPVDGNLLRQLRDSIHGDCFMGEDWEKETVDKLLATHPQPAAAKDGDA